jgi:hypothetical protein
MAGKVWLCGDRFGVLDAAAFQPHHAGVKAAANRPIGYVDSAVMLNAKLIKGVTLLHVIALTKSLGELQSAKDAQPEVFRWTDGTQSNVTCTFDEGKLSTWVLWRPEQTAETVETPVTEVKPSVL